MQIINGKEIADQLKGEMAAEVERLRSERGRAPHLAAILVGNDPASETYVKNKEKSCHEVGISSSVYRLPENTTEEQLLEAIDFINNDEEVDGLIVQLPLPKGLDADKIVSRIAPEKDVDGFHPLNGAWPAYLPACHAYGHHAVVGKGRHWYGGPALCCGWTEQHCGHTRFAAALAQQERRQLHGDALPQQDAEPVGSMPYRRHTHCRHRKV